MNELKALLHDVAEDAIDLTQCTLDAHPEGMDLQDCFPYETYRNIRIDGKDYRVKVTIQLVNMEW